MHRPTLRAFERLVPGRGVTREERAAHIRAVVDSAPLPGPEDLDRLRLLLQLHTRPTAASAPEHKRSAAAAA